jgi:hypothetical protein
VQAKWNLELTLRDREKNKLEKPQSGGNDQQNPQPQQDQNKNGGGAPSPQPQSQAGPGESAGTAAGQQPLSKEEADRILSAVEQNERELTRETLRKGQRSTSVARDW